ncbi:MAG: Na/Pi cotransporter family protein [Synergistaceae bacterium]|nr:Na/Pi symporter [Synergistota bacterium]NLM71305.1 Na/Pi cotransporter family protein [Synergistaceae bacterium]
MNPQLLAAINILGGLALFLYGIEQTTIAFGTSFGDKAKELLLRFTQKKPMAFLFGVVLAAIGQGSTLGTAFAVGFVDAGMLSFAGSVVVMMGTSVGGTFVTFLLSMNIAVYSPLMFCASYLMVRFGRGNVYRIGRVLQGISIVLLGMFVLKIGVPSLLNAPWFSRMLTVTANSPWLVGIVAFLATTILQSNSAVLAVVITLADAGALPVSSFLPIVCAARITVVLAAFVGRHNAKKLGVCTLIYKILGVLIVIPFWGLAQRLIASSTADMAVLVFQVQLGVAIFNSIVFYPLSDWLARLTDRLMERGKEESLGDPVYLDEELLEVPALAILLLSKEIIRLANYIELYCQSLFLTDKSMPGLEEQNSLPEAIDSLSEACQEYMFRIRVPSEDKVLKADYSSVSYSVLSFRQMAKILMGELRLLAEAGVAEQFKRELGDDTWKEFSSLVLINVRYALRAFALADADFASDAGHYGREYEELERKIRLWLGVDAISRRELAPLLDYMSQAYLLVKTSLEIARGEAHRYRDTSRNH